MSDKNKFASRYKVNEWETNPTMYSGLQCTKCGCRAFMVSCGTSEYPYTKLTCHDCGGQIEWDS